MIDPIGNAIIVVTKAPDGRNELYEAPLLPQDGQIRLRRAGTVPLTGTDEESDPTSAAATGGAISQDGHTIVIRSNHRAVIWRRRGSESVATALQSTPCIVDLSREGQGEAIAITPDGHVLSSGEADTPIIQEWRPGP